MAAAIWAAMGRSDRCLLGLSGGSTPAPFLVALADRDLLWLMVTILQVDERIVAADDPARNLGSQQAALGHLGARWLPLPVEDLLEIAPDDPDAGTEVAAVLDAFSSALVELAGGPPLLDLVHLGLGDDGHTASLIPGDPLVDELRAYVGLTETYRGTRRISLTRPVLDRARMVVWLVRGSSKAEPLGRLLAGDLSIPAGLVRPAHSVVLADGEAARQR
jgi:6-phosphogluconolactonase/glucosamine-6-phosphate isomerase/deaminase